MKRDSSRYSARQLLLWLSYGAQIGQGTLQRLTGEVTVEITESIAASESGGFSQARSSEESNETSTTSQESRDNDTPKGQGARIPLRALFEMGEEELQKAVSGRYRDLKNAGAATGRLLRARCLDPQGLEEQIMRTKVRYVTILDEEYPAKLRETPDPPYLLYYIGSLPDERLPSVGMIGTRASTVYGRKQAEQFASALAFAGVQIISGMARGIDGVSGRSALLAGGRSFAVLGCGPDICYPEENRDLYEQLQLQEGSGILSEYCPGTQPVSGLFPLRNRIISGLSDALLVVEARERSGTMITVERALDQNREVYALPARVTDAASSGCLQLLRQGAMIATRPEDILEDIFGIAADLRAGTQRKHEKATQLELSQEAPGKGEPTRISSAQLTQLEAAVLRSLDEGEERSADDIYESVRQALGYSAGIREITTTLLMLSMRGIIREESPGRYTVGGILEA